MQESFAARFYLRRYRLSGSRILSDTEIIQRVFDKRYHCNLKPDIFGYMVFQWVGKVPAWLENDTCDGRKIYVTKVFLKTAKDKLIIAQRIFFSRSYAGN
jgi:hypothetical protein